jgi:hypothetical protein
VDNDDIRHPALFPDLGEELFKRVEPPADAPIPTMGKFISCSPPVLWSDSSSAPGSAPLFSLFFSSIYFSKDYSVNGKLTVLP